MNLPNKITLTRIFLIPFVIFFYLANFIPLNKLFALILFVVAVLTDFFDGKLARKLNLVTTLGVFLDSIADKMLTLSVFALVLCQGEVLQPIGVVSFIVVLCRELIVSALRQIASSNNLIIKADMWGKVKATIQFVTIILFMFYFFLLDSFALPDVLQGVIGGICYFALALTVLSTVVSGVHYLVQNKQVFKS